MISTSDFRKIKLLIFDVDGTLTDGSYSYNADGTTGKFFNIQDHHWLKLAARAGLKTALLTGRNDPNNKKFADEVMISDVVFSKSKLESYEELLAKYDLSPEETLYAGDDVIDMPVLRRAGIAVVPADAVSVLDEVSPWRTHAKGGRGVAQEVIFKVFQEQGLLDQVMERYRQ
jgi:3-deoxy-D-manno-octulosonate 8-phosphate phosphatase (KDO 8-P phosphatase)